MTDDEWQTSTDPLAMIAWLSKQGYDERLWDFAVACCRRVAHGMPSERFRRIAEHVERVGTRGVDDLLAIAAVELRALEQDARRAVNQSDQSQRNRQLGFGRLVFAFEHQDGASVATAISEHLIEWADDESTERAQTSLLRELVADPSRRFEWDEDGIV